MYTVKYLDMRCVIIEGRDANHESLIDAYNNGHDEMDSSMIPRGGWNGMDCSLLLSWVVEKYRATAQHIQKS